MLAPPLNHALDRAIAIAEDQGFDLYLAGGALRDLLAGGEGLDLDLVTEGSAALLAEALAADLRGQVKVYGRFGTTAVMFAGGRVDIARARGEYYERPGALPTVHPAPLREDLERRDFTVNAMALGLTGAHKDVLLDPTGGRDDLRRQRIRVIHRNSFVDDATRTLRGLRYASRLDFTIEPETRHLIREFAPYLRTISASRLRTEVDFVLGDRRPWRSLEAAHELGILDALASGLGWDEPRSGQARRYNRRPRAERVIRLSILLASTLVKDGAGELIKRLGLGGRDQRLIEQAARFASESIVQRRRGQVKRALWAGRFDEIVMTTLAPLYFGQRANELRRAARLRPRLSGDDLIAIGFRSGPAVGRVLQKLLVARLEGTASSKADELALARKELQSLPASRPR